jgi:hypothetical protein
MALAESKGTGRNGVKLSLNAFGGKLFTELFARQPHEAVLLGVAFFDARFVALGAIKGGRRY